MMARMVRVLAIVVAVLLLAGCVPTKPIPEPGFTDAEREAWFDWVQDLRWGQLGLPDAQRPQIVRSEVDVNEQPVVLKGCMAERGFPLDESGLYSSLDQDDQDFRLARFVCETSFVVDPDAIGWLNDGQIDYLYDYYQDVLIPCVTSAGYAVRTVPDRSSFVTEWWWHPFYEVPDFQVGVLTVPEDVLDRCAPFPPGDVLHLEF